MLRILSWIAVAIVALAALLLLPIPWPDAFVGSHVVNRIEIAAPPERVFAYVTTPANWPRWHPASRAVRGVVDRAPAVGESVVETFEIAGRRDDATWTTAELDPPRRWVIVSGAPGGGYAHIVYTLSTKGGGALWERDLTYRGPNLLFGILNVLQIRTVMEFDSAKALANVKRQVEAMPP
ncbi:MAG: SRPBCC family protein [Pseudomonadota bacterium]|nr:SRPBCC family protein [Pseudomonadota bacterium]